MRRRVSSEGEFASPLRTAASASSKFIRVPFPPLARTLLPPVSAMARPISLQRASRRDQKAHRPVWQASDAQVEGASGAAQEQPNESGEPCSDLLIPWRRTA